MVQKVDKHKQPALARVRLTNHCCLWDLRTLSLVPIRAPRLIHFVYKVDVDHVYYHHILNYHNTPYNSPKFLMTDDEP